MGEPAETLTLHTVEAAGMATPPRRTQAAAGPGACHHRRHTRCGSRLPATPSTDWGCGLSLATPLATGLPPVPISLHTTLPLLPLPTSHLLLSLLPYACMAGTPAQDSPHCLGGMVPAYAFSLPGCCPHLIPTCPGQGRTTSAPPTTYRFTPCPHTCLGGLLLPHSPGLPTLLPPACSCGTPAPPPPPLMGGAVASVSCHTFSQEIHSTCTCPPPWTEDIPPPHSLQHAFPGPTCLPAHAYPIHALHMPCYAPGLDLAPSCPFSHRCSHCLPATTTWQTLPHHLPSSATPHTFVAIALHSPGRWDGTSGVPSLPCLLHTCCTFARLAPAPHRHATHHAAAGDFCPRPACTCHLPLPTHYPTLPTLLRVGHLTCRHIQHYSLPPSLIMPIFTHQTVAAPGYRAYTTPHTRLPLPDTAHRVGDASCYHLPPLLPDTTHLMTTYLHERGGLAVDAFNPSASSTTVDIFLISYLPVVTNTFLRAVLCCARRYSSHCTTPATPLNMPSLHVTRLPDAPPNLLVGRFGCGL